MVLHFESAINPYGCSPRVVTAMQEFAATRDYKFYGEMRAESLRVKLAELHGLSPENFVVCNGSGEALAGIYLLRLVMAGGSLIVPYPSYERFVDGGKKFARSSYEVPLEPEMWALDIDRMIAETNANNTTLGMISSPNNPTGNILLDETSAAKLLAATPQCLWVIDEAYADYNNRTLAPLVKNHENLAVLKTFSKAYGMAGMRIGYVVAAELLAKQLASVQLPWAVNSMSLVAAAAALEDQEHIRKVSEAVKYDVRKFYEELVKFPQFTVFPTDANFFLIRVADGKQPELIRYLAERDMIVRSRGDMPDYIRVTSLLPEENEMLLSAIREFFAK